MTTILLEPEGIRIPSGLTDLERFRDWARSHDFPEKGRIDWLAGELVVDMTAENLDRHGTLKSALSREIGILVEPTDRGVVFIDAARLSSIEADLSSEPDIVVVLFDSIESGRVRLVPSKDHPDEYVEIEGAADLVVECVSRSSKAKDVKRLPPLYHRAGVREYWLADATGPRPSLLVHDWTRRGYRQASPDRRGFRRSKVLGVSVRLTAFPPRAGLIRYQLAVR